MKSFARTRIAIVATLMGALSLTTVGFVATSADAGNSVARSDHWPS